MNMDVILGILLPFAGTTLGAAMVFFMRKEMNEKLQKGLLGFASGVMIAASVWSLLIPAIEMAEEGGQIAWIHTTGSVSAWDWLSAFAGHGDTSPALSGIGAGRDSGITSKNNNVDARSDAAQYSGRNGSGCDLCRSSFG